MAELSEERVREIAKEEILKHEYKKPLLWGDLSITPHTKGRKSKKVKNT